ncbi:MAG: transcription termination factor NusA [Clostridiales Family XIII bacterium]|jgi:N utilization substance protein A|nr:transcription termination factor NusA [Clostridiales Family XIII bacterium]
MNKEFIQALDDLEKEKGIPKEKLLEAVEKALVSAYRGRNKSPDENVRAEIDPETGEIEIHHRKYVVEEVTDPNAEVALEEMLQYDPDYVIGDVVDYNMPLDSLGRIAAQTAKQVVVQTVREIERGMVYDEFIGRQGELVNGTIQRVSNETVFVNLGRTEGIMSPGEQVRGERYTVNSRLKFYIMDVRKSQKGPQVFLSRSHPGLVKRLFELEVPEVQDGIVEIESLAREAGSRTKMAVSASDESVDPVGACVGNRGIRVQAVVDELFGEKIDIIAWSDVTEDNISSALSPAKAEKIVLEADEKTATAIVPDYQLSLAIGKEGQNVRLAAKLCGVKIDIKSHSAYFGDPQPILTGVLDEEGYLNPADFIDYVPANKRSDANEDAEDVVAEATEADVSPEIVNEALVPEADESETDEYSQDEYLSGVHADGKTSGTEISDADAVSANEEIGTKNEE